MTSPHSHTPQSGSLSHAHRDWATRTAASVHLPKAGYSIQSTEVTNGVSDSLQKAVKPSASLFTDVNTSQVFWGVEWVGGGGGEAEVGYLFTLK